MTASGSASKTSKRTRDDLSEGEEDERAGKRADDQEVKYGEGDRAKDKGSLSSSASVNKKLHMDEESDDDDIGPMPPPPGAGNESEEEDQKPVKERDDSPARRPPPAPSASAGASNSNSKVTKNLMDRMGGAYIPPARLRAMQAAITDKNSADYQRMTWEALKKSINGLINKVNTSNIKNIVPELFSENLIRGRGLLCRSIMKAQAASLPFTPVYAALIAVINTKFPQIGELLLVRLISQYRRAYRRNDKTVCLAVTKFIGHLVNQKVAHELVAFEILMLLLERPTDDSVEVAVGLMKDVGAFLTDMAPRANNAIFERFRSILHEGSIDKRTQYMVEVLFQVRKDKYKDNPAVPSELELVEDEDQITHPKSLDDEDLNVEEGLNVFKYDPDYVTNEEKYNAIKKEILGDSDDEEEDEDGDEEEDDEDDNEVDAAEAMKQAQAKMMIHDATNTNLINLRRGIYLTIMSSLNFEECAHKLMKLGVQPGQEIELCNMIIECCSQERTYVNFYGLLGERFCRLSLAWADAFAQCFEDTYNTIHRYETNRLRNIAKYFAHLLASDALSWNVLALVRLTEQDTTSASRIFIKILFEELMSSLGLKKLRDRLFDTNMVISVQTDNGLQTRGVFDGLFPKDNPRNTRFAINYFTSIKLGALTTELREHLKNAPKIIMAQQQEVESSDSESDSSDSSDADSSSESDSDDSSDSDSSDSSSSSSGSDSDDDRNKRSAPDRRASDKGRGPSDIRKSESARDRRPSFDDRDSARRSNRQDSRERVDERNTRDIGRDRRRSPDDRRDRDRDRDRGDDRRRDGRDDGRSDRRRSPEGRSDRYDKYEKGRGR
ncbi:pre-mRNA-splicing factor cwc22 [Blyttiomyces sp. JEL0837]|nr:pre-mRNA-splicing factor cwc22 [Blyttiomyces sp. JEL0837]